MPRMPERRDGLKSLERTFTVIILVWCAISLYLTSISKSTSHRLARMGTGYTFHSDKDQVGKGMFRSIFKAHDHRDIFHRHKQDITLTVYTENSTSKPIDKPVYNMVDWFNRTNPKVESFNHLEHPYYSRFIISNEDICKSQNVDILIYVQSFTKNYQRRRILRETWANQNTFQNITVKAVFILGRTTDSWEQLKVQNENLVYNDIIQGDFIDSQKNLTLKAILISRWISQYCPQAKYVIKADDDIFVNIFSFVENFISGIWQRRKTIMCHLKQNGSAPIVRNEKSKWYVSHDLFVGQKYFPQFCTGYALLFTGDLAAIMYNASFRTPFIPIDDVYMFGLLVEHDSAVSFINVQSNLTLNQKLALEEYSGNNVITHAASNAWENGAMEKFWFATLDKLSPWALKHSSFATLERRRLLVSGDI